MLRFECVLEGTKEEPASFTGTLSDVLDRMDHYQASPGDVIDIVLPFFRIDINALKTIGRHIEKFVSQGAHIQTLNFDPKKNRGRARMEYSVAGEAADIGDEGVLHLYHILTSAPPIIGLDMASLLPCRSAATDLEYLHLGHCSIEQTGVVSLTRLLSRLPKLKALHLSDNEGIGSNFVTLAEQLQLMTNMKDLNLTQCSLGSHGAKVLSSILPYMPSLEKLHLTYNHISSGSMERVCAQFSLLTNLRMLFLSYNALGNSSNTSKLQTSSSKSPVAPKSSRYLNSGLAFCHHLTILHMHHCTLGESGTCFLLESAVSQQLTSLESLRIDHNGVQPNSQNFLKALVAAIGALKHIQQLWFRQVGLHFTDKCGRLDESSIPISTSGMNDFTARKILEELLKCERMRFDSTGIDDNALATLAIEFNKLPAPRDWNLKYHDVSYLEISQKMFSITIDLAESGSIKEIYDSNIILHESIGQGGFGTVFKVFRVVRILFTVPGSFQFICLSRRHGSTLRSLMNLWP